ncbi:hypothetical protein PIROE2DRAFT_1152 [Piromyces sp. E2]|nr:hypothetical protein PIROE2DRAFT_1152 [Piromyces sp. E2]|eukprot:OUM70625.1 hypothetical protein PIROE2DRAFT_1152 [Piromyces sp. E2]
MSKDSLSNNNNNFPIPSGTTFSSHNVPDSEYTLYCFQFVQYDAEKQYPLKEGKETDWISED